MISIFFFTKDIIVIFRIQHQKLCELASKVESAVYKFVKREELKEILTELFNYMKEHFSNEEDYMQEIHYPYLNEHKIMHKISFVICLILYKT